MAGFSHGIDVNPEEMKITKTIIKTKTLMSSATTAAVRSSNLEEILKEVEKELANLKKLGFVVKVTNDYTFELAKKYGNDGNIRVEVLRYVDDLNFSLTVDYKLAGGRLRAVYGEDDVDLSRVRSVFIRLMIKVTRYDEILEKMQDL